MASYSADRQRRIIYHAAKKWGIKPSILWGVYGTETSFGRNTSTSSAGAQGPFQFLPSTARGMGVNPNDFHSAAYGAAKYLAQYKGRGTAGMLSAYNAGPAGGSVPSYVSSVLGNARSWKAPGGTSGSGGASSTGGTRTIPGVDRSGERRAAIASYLVNEPNDVAPSVNAKSPMTIANQGDQSGDNLIALTQQLSAIKDTPSRTVPTGGAPGPSGHSGNSAVDRMLSMARAFDKHHTSYLWGGGHGGIAGPADRVDCSGYVSAILHAGGLLGSPLVSGSLANWGHPGHGKYVTVYANSGHVLIEINGRFFATSHSNPGGGPGEIPRPSSSYLSSFTARHPGLP